MRGNTLTAVEYLHRALGQPCLDLLADQGMRDGVEEPGGCDVIVDADPCKRPFGIFMIGVGQRSHRWTFDRLEQLSPTDAEAAHDAIVQLHQYPADRRIAFGQREELQVAQSTQQVELSDAYSSLDFCFVFWMIRPCWQYADTVMCSHRAITAVDLGIIERGLVHAALEIVGHQQAGPRTPEPEHPHMRADPVRQALCPGC